MTVASLQDTLQRLRQGVARGISANRLPTRGALRLLRAEAHGYSMRLSVYRTEPAPASALAKQTGRG